MRHRGLHRVGLRSGELGRESEGRSPAADREAALREAGHDHQRELQALGLVGREHGDRVRGIERPVVIGVVARPIRQQVKVRHQEREARIGQPAVRGPWSVDLHIQDFYSATGPS